MEGKEVFIVGGGPGGVKLASELRKLGFEGKIRLFEANFLGGECTNVGCIPSKTLYNFSKLAQTHRKLIGKTLNIEPSVIYSTINKVVNTIRKGIEHNLKKDEVDVVFGYCYVDKDRVIFEGSSYSPDALVIATGSRPIASVGKENLKSERVMTNRELWGTYLEEFLKHLSKGCRVLIIGGGYIGLETACMMANIFNSSHFEIFEKQSTVIPFADFDVISEISRYLSRLQNLSIKTGVEISKIEEVGNLIRVEYRLGEQLRVDEFDFVILSLGRAPNLPFYDLKNYGFLEVDEFLRVKGYDKVWAIGDVIGGKLLAHKAEYQAKIVAKNILDYFYGREPRVRYTKTNELQIPSIMFTIPEVGWYGLTEQEVQKLGVEYFSRKYLLAGNARAIVDMTREGMVKILYNQRGEVLGVHVVSHDVSELINIPMVYSSETIVYAHPTLAEIWQDIL